MLDGGHLLFFAIEAVTRIARENKVSYKSLAKWNGMGPKDPLRVGQKLVIWCTLTVAETGKYTFILNALNVQDESIEKPVVSVTKSADAPTFGETALYLRGDVTDANWAAIESAKFSYVANDVYSLDINLTAGSFEMKIANSDWADATNFGGQGAIEFGTPLTMESGGGNISITVPADGSYNFHFNAADTTAPIVTVTQN